MTTHDHDQPMCEARVSDDSGVGLHPCSRRGVVDRDGEWWCKLELSTDEHGFTHVVITPKDDKQ